MSGSRSGAEGVSAAYSGSRALVLGAGGFIGRWVARALCRADARVALVVRDAAAVKPMFARYGIEGDVFEADLAEASAVGELVHAVHPTIVFNLAGYGVDPSERDEGMADLLNRRLVERLAAAMASSRDPRWPGQDIVHAGSALEYGGVEGDLAEDSRTAPSTVYGRSKLAGTQALTQRCATTGLRAVTVRLFTVYGPGEHPERLLPSLLLTRDTRRPLPLTSGSQRRDFTYVGDVAEGLLRLGLATPDWPVVNLATGRLTSVRGFAERAADLLGIPRGDLRFGALPSRPEEMAHSPVALARLRQLTDWIPPTTVDDGIRLTVAFTT